jgi:hypothetical protein
MKDKSKQFRDRVLSGINLCKSYDAHMIEPFVQRCCKLQNEHNANYRLENSG